ncbi:MAG: hypothetical protein GW870_03410, partial [Deltaproteobacteria bacterium]|nr:hypothetical protein [Deltaproteobacteria bacterium]
LAGWRARLDSACGRAEGVVARVRQKGVTAAEPAAWLRHSDAALRFLREAGPLHNPEATLAVCEQIARGVEPAAE